ncbi:MAG: hypothetical protein KDB68_14410 [Planctomycetes bacterium]|nr:hypothetical protein [Planctomycetota bacterium]
MADMLEKYRDDLTDFVRGRLDQARAAEILQAAQQDETLKAAIESERSLDRWLEYYELPELSDGFEGRFWRRFHAEKLDEATTRSTWMFKLIGPLAAGVLIAIGVVLFVNNDDAPVTDPTTAETQETEDNAPVIETDWTDEEIQYITGGTEEDTKLDRLGVEELELLKALDDAAFLPLDELERPEDLLLADDLDTINKLAEDD